MNRTQAPEELIGIIPKELFIYLSTYRSGICISIILPTHAAGVEVNEHLDRIAFKTSLLQVEKILTERNTDHATIKKILQPGFDLLEDDIWYSMKNGLAVYIAEDFIKFLRLPGDVNKEILVNSSFSVMPLVPFMVRKEFFYILSINKKNCRFYRADAFGIEHIPIDELPVGVDDVVNLENANYHGLGGGNPDEKQNISIYLEEVDDTLWKSHLHYSNVPLLLAGLEYLIPLYRSVSDYKYTWHEALAGNHQYQDSDKLYQQAMKVMGPYFDRARKNALKEYGNKSATNLTSIKHSEIIPAAYFGMVSHLFVQKNAHIWGTFNEDSGELHIKDEEKAGTENLADRAVAKTIESGGSVFTLDKSEIPGTTKMAAIFRYQSTK